MSERLTVSLSEAIELLPKSEKVHCFSNPAASVLVGADWERDEVIRTFQQAEKIFISGPSAQSTGHGLFISQDGRNLFFEAANADEQETALSGNAT